jgi:hypothetical protein
MTPIRPNTTVYGRPWLMMKGLLQNFESGFEAIDT